MKISERLQRIQNLPLTKRKIIFWFIMTIFGLTLFTLYILNIRQKIKTFPVEESLKELKLPEFEEKLEKLPKFETGGKIKEIRGEVEEIKRLIEEAEK